MIEVLYVHACMVKMDTFCVLRSSSPSAILLFYSLLFNALLDKKLLNWY